MIAAALRTGITAAAAPTRRPAHRSQMQLPSQGPRPDPTLVRLKHMDLTFKLLSQLAFLPNYVLLPERRCGRHPTPRVGWVEREGGS
jgi:hypothetical protein